MFLISNVISALERTLKDLYVNIRKINFICYIYICFNQNLQEKVLYKH